ncbi:helix-turn-helix domain-containing protein [Corynebacterium sanguinis]|nr:helix-turn-helix domain-containing protein [Corynebacterium sanguinis]
MASSARRREPHTVMPPAQLDELLDLRKFLSIIREDAALLGPDGQTVPLPEEVFRVLCDVVDAMQEGKAITLAPIDQLMTTQETANFLGISRPTLVKLLEEGEIAFERTTGGRHRKVRLADAIEYQERKRIQRRTALRNLTSEAAALGLYDADSENYREALT